MDSGEEILPPAFRVVNESGTSPYVLVCEHASRFMPKHYHGLGLSEVDLMSHIAWDIGAENVALQLSERINAPLIAANYSRLIVDLNRPPRSPTSIPEASETTVVPGNIGLNTEEKCRRVENYFVPFHTRLSQLLDVRQKIGVPTIIVGIHSFTPVYNGISRPWYAGILFRQSVLFGRALVEALGGTASNITANEPYQIDDWSDYTVPIHGEARGLEAVLVELRQDLVSDELGISEWVERMSLALVACVDFSSIHCDEDHAMSPRSGTI